MKTWYVIRVTCCDSTYRMVRQFDPRRNKKGPRCLRCNKAVTKRRWRYITSLPAPTVEDAMFYAMYVISSKKHRSWHPSTPDERKLAELGLYMMETMMRKIVLIPAPIHEYGSGGRKIRVVEEENPPWYSVMAQRRGFGIAGRGKRYGPLRQYVIAALKRILSGWKNPRGLEDEILEEVEEYYQDAMRGKYGQFR